MENKILVIIDVQNGIRSSVPVAILIRKLVELLEARVFNKIIATQFILTSYNPIKTIYGWEGFRFADDYEIVEELKSYIDITVAKSTYSCMDKDFLNILKSVNDGTVPSEVYLAGCETDVCVFNSAVDLFEIGIRPIVLSNYCVSSKGSEQHDAAIKCLARNIGRGQINFAQSIDELRDGTFC